LDLREVSLLQAIQHLTEATGFGYEIRDSTVVISSPQTSFHFQTRRFDVVFESADAGSGNAEVDPRDILAMLKAEGVSFPNGTGFSYPSHGQAGSALVVTHTRETLDQIDQILSKLAKPPAVRIFNQSHRMFLPVRLNNGAQSSRRRSLL